LAFAVSATRAQAPRPPLRFALYTLRTRHPRPRLCQVPSAFRAGGRLQGLLVGADFCEGICVDYVGDRAAGAFVAEVAGGFAPAFGAHPILLAEEGDEDAGLVGAEARQRVDPGEQVLPGGGAGPDVGGVAVVTVDDQLAQL